MSKLGPSQLAEVLRHIPISADPNLLVGFDSRDDAGVFRVSDTLALVQTVDFFTPIVDDPYAYGQIAAANALSDVYAMGGKPLTVLNIVCFDPDVVPPDVWAEVIRGAYDKTVEAGAVVVGGHSVKDPQPKFGMAVTGTVDPFRMFTNSAAEVGDRIYLTKPIGTGIVTTAAMADMCPSELLQKAITQMSTLNREAAEAGISAGVACATDITGFGLGGHVFNVAKASKVRIKIDFESVPVFEGIASLVEGGYTTGTAAKNRAFTASSLFTGFEPNSFQQQAFFDPQTSGGLALFSKHDLPYPCIGEVVAGDWGIELM